MAINMSKLAAIAESYMPDECVISSLSYGAVGAGNAVTATKTTVYEGKCMIWQSSPNSNPQDMIVRSGVYYAGIPLEEALVTEDMILEVIESHDEELITRIFKVGGINAGTYAAFRYFELRAYSTENE